MPQAPKPFIVGAARSGTTLLRMMLDSHSTLAIPPETYFAVRAEAAFERTGVQGVVESIVDSPVWADFGLASADLTAAVHSRPAASAEGVLRAFYELYAARWGKPRWGDKTPIYVLAMEKIQRLVPEAHFVHVVRDGRDVAVSTAPLWFGPDEVGELAGEWSRQLRSARRQAPSLAAYTEVRFEELVRDPAAVLRELCAFLDLEWEPSMLDYHRDGLQRLADEMPAFRWDGETISGERRTRIHSFIGRPPDSGRCGRWREEMSARDLSEFERLAGDTLAEFGYPLSVGY